MSIDKDTKAIRERAKAIAEQRRIERRQRRRRCVVCGVEEAERTPLIAHPEGLGPSCKDLEGCAARLGTPSR